ncbi:PadR family transcriptional regulator [Rouxiella sp. S1S-2]|uniref:PadR family transcriptional regulator n=1 Tax=Rouxiella sp. S1S-2 TaxID=2653856 RepID=UPI0012646D28|nr:PadR family transcriptional regulator [Rouxiella sp. S1S-2]KAB7896679.1 PadR family transcriptional regulator [Rouxiella sp. S1S-2]
MKKIYAIHVPPKKNHARRGKTFKNEELLLLVLYFIKINPTHGYGIIKSIENYSMGGYVPSAGVIYPNLTMLEDLGHTQIQHIGENRKKFFITALGEKHLAEKKFDIETILEKLKALVSEKNPVRNPEIYYALENLKIIVKIKMRNESINNEDIEKIIQTIQEATHRINDI